MRELKAYFEAGQLTEVQFSDGINGETRRCIRGKSGGAYRSAGSFQWTSAVRGLSLLMLRSVTRLSNGVLMGGNATLAASLDYAISKQPVWLTEMFGCDQSGICLIRRAVLRTNPERKRPGPTALAINEKFLPVSSIAIFINGRKASGEELISLASALSDEALPNQQLAA